MVDGCEYTLSAGDVLVINRFEGHCAASSDGGYENYCLILQQEGLLKSPLSVRLFSYMINRPEGFVRVFHPGRDSDAIRHVFVSLETECSGANKYKTEYMLLLMEQLLILLSRHCPASLGSTSGDRMEPIIQEIETGFTDPCMTVSALAAGHFMSEDHFIRIFRRATGFSPGHYILLNRLVLARELLTSTEDILPVVAQKAGFGDVNNFIRTFKKQFGVPPGKYRRGARAGINPDDKT